MTKVEALQFINVPDAFVLVEAVGDLRGDDFCKKMVGTTREEALHSMVKQ